MRKRKEANSGNKWRGVYLQSTAKMFGANALRVEIKKIIHINVSSGISGFLVQTIDTSARRYLFAYLFARSAHNIHAVYILNLIIVAFLLCFY